MSITITRGDHNTAPESDFAGTVSVRHMRVDKTLSEAADRELGRMRAVLNTLQNLKRVGT